MIAEQDIMIIKNELGDEKFNEFINLNIDDKTRTFTKPQKLRNDFRKILYIDINVDYLDKNKNIVELAIDELKDFTKSNLLGVINISKELIK